MRCTFIHKCAFIHKSDLGSPFSAHIMSSHGHTPSIFLPVFIKFFSKGLSRTKT